MVVSIAVSFISAATNIELRDSLVTIHLNVYLDGMSATTALAQEVEGFANFGGGS